MFGTFTTLLAATCIASGVQLSDYIQDNWRRTIRFNRTDEGTKIGLPFKYTVPCMADKFQEMYYWDTYFTNVGLILSGLTEQARDNVGNIAYLIEKFGYMPNGNRTYYLSRSQPPLFTRMVSEVYDAKPDKAWLAKMYAAAVKEHAFWQTQRRTASGLNRYSGSFRDDAQRKAIVEEFIPRAGWKMPTDPQEVRRMSEIFISYAESGWDCTSRFDFNPQENDWVDLNSLLYGMERDLERFAGILGNGEETKWRTAAEKRRALMNRVMWDEQLGMFCDHDFVKGARSQFVSAAAFYPLFVGLATPEQAKRTVALLPRIECAFGIAASQKDGIKDLQWDYPHGWACLQYVVVKGLLRYGYTEDAWRIAKKYSRMVERVFAETGSLWEKYDVARGKVSVSREYETPKMLGWSAGVYLDFARMPKVMVVDCPKCEYLARYADDGKSATVNRARFSGEGAEAAITSAVRRAEAVLAANVVPDEAVRPLMGWSSWNCFALEINEEKIVSQAVAMASNGLKQAGFLYINTDDGFFDGHDEKGNLKWNLKRFPKGMKPVVDGIHAQGLKAGIYSDAGADMCGGSKGSGLYGHDAADCDLHFKQLGFDYIKVDYCGGLKLKLDERERYTEISKAIRATRRDVKFNICRWAYPGTWAADVADSWRVTGDIRASWKSVRQTFLVGLPLSAYASRGHYNDLDMLEIGHAPGWKPTFDGDAGLTADEEIAHFGLWCIQSSPLVLGCDLRTMPQSALDLVTNPYLLAMNANDLGLQAYPVRHEGEVVTLVKDAGERYGLSRYVAVVNLGDVAAKADLRLADLDLGGRAYVVDLVAKAEIGSFEKSMSLTLKPHSAKFYRLFADRRLDRCVYRADCAWMRRYHKLSWSDDAPMYQVVQPGPGEDGDRVDAVFGLGRHADNDLLWKDVRVSEAGTYELSFTVLADAPRRFSVGVGGQPPVQLTVPAKRWTQKISCRLYLAAGTHAVRIFNDSAPAPGIVEMSLKRIDGQHEATDKETEVVGSVGTESFGYLSWNIGHYAWGKDWKSTVKPEDGACRAEAYRAFLEKIGADVVGLCEYAEDFTANGSMKASAAVFGGYPNSSIGPSRSYQWNAQFWRGFKVLEKKTVDYAERHQQVYYQATRLLIGSRDVWIVQTHLDWTTFKKGFEHCRERQMQKLIDDFRDQPRVVISGDFNVGDRGSNGVRREKTIPAPEEYDVFVRAGYTLANASGTPTCPSDNPTQPLDNIIVKGLDVSQVRFHPAGDLSDHNAVSCTLTLRPVAE